MLGWDEGIKKSFKRCGNNVYIGHNVMFANPSNISLGDNVRVDPFTLITCGLETGNNVQICSHVVLGGGSGRKVVLGDWTFIGYGSKLFCASEDYSGDHGPVNEFWGKNKIYEGDIILENYSGVASDVIVFPGVSIPEGCTVGAQSLIHTKNNLEPWSVFIGNPLVFHKGRNRDEVLRLSKSPEFIK